MCWSLLLSTFCTVLVFHFALHFALLSRNCSENNLTCIITVNCSVCEFSEDCMRSHLRACQSGFQFVFVLLVWWPDYKCLSKMSGALLFGFLRCATVRMLSRMTGISIDTYISRWQLDICLYLAFLYKKAKCCIMVCENWELTCSHYTVRGVMLDCVLYRKSQRIYFDPQSLVIDMTVTKHYLHY